MQFEKEGRGLLREAFWSQGECFVCRKRVGTKRKNRYWKTEVNIGVLLVIKTNTQYLTASVFSPYLFSLVTSFCQKNNCILLTNKLDLTGKNQHGFKHNKSNATPGALLQSIISSAADDKCFVIMANLDLSMAFDLVNTFRKMIKDNGNAHGRY